MAMKCRITVNKCHQQAAELEVDLSLLSSNSYIRTARPRTQDNEQHTLSHMCTIHFDGNDCCSTASDSQDPDLTTWILCAVTSASRITVKDHRPGRRLCIYCKTGEQQQAKARYKAAPD